MRAITPAFNSAQTSGFWTTETEAAQAFDLLIERLSGLFRMYKEVEGRYQHYRPSQQYRTARIDRILVPTSQLRKVGWNIGPIGVELKKSGADLGPPLCQLIDYTHATWNLNGNWIIPEWYFLWPCDRLTGPLQSVVANQRCGGVYRSSHHELIFHSANIIAKLSSRNIDIRPDNTRHGRKTGSR